MQKEKRVKKIAVGNQKGGVSKTTTCIHLAAGLGELGRKCLVWDLDGNAGATRHFGIPEEANFLGTFEVLLGVEKPEDVIITGDDPSDEVKLPKNVHLIPARRNLERFETALREKDKFIGPRDIFIDPLSSLVGYDYIFFDTAPNAGILTIATYLASDWFILAAIPEHFAIDGLKAALLDIQNAQERASSSVALLGVVLSCVNKRYRTAQLLSEIVTRTFTPEGGGPSLKFKTEIDRSVVVPQTQAQGLTLFETDPSHKVTEQYRALAREVEERLRIMERLEQSADVTTGAEAVVAHG